MVKHQLSLVAQSEHRMTVRSQSSQRTESSSKAPLATSISVRWTGRTKAGTPVVFQTALEMTRPSENFESLVNTTLNLIQTNSM